ncbi:serine hydrolase [Schumannella sp. 10F1B-5-1]|uniref:serine hydrolase domain-containing protein n=1 Tax=Schumannella sp. 10F1B-5-1 TaxID=2590780 RepID=UPI0011314312|nr:serine hydrolase domain-containing protein [Schumannella sp. 10F1B-5-1]TPW72317.1 beta-lactamase family protein [Schumannella sp. 10F1B-5-1]
MHSLMLVRHGHVVAEGWWAPYRAELPHTLNSVSKSVTALAVGIALDEGLFDLDDAVLDLLPDHAPAEPSARQRRLTVRHLLTMTRGCAEPDFDGVRSGAIADGVRFVLNEPLDHEPGERFVYSTGSTFLVSAIIQRLTGERLLDWVAPRLFEPLGITTREWDASADGVDFGGSGLHLRTEELALLGQLLLQRGSWNGRQLVDAAWIDEATSWHVETMAVPSDPGAPLGDWELGYGFQFWQTSHGACRADGAFGQFIVALPELDAVIVTTAGLDDMAAVLDAVWQHLLPGFDTPGIGGATSTAVAAGGVDAQARLRAQLAALTLPPQHGASSSPAAARLLGRRVEVEAGPAGLRALRIDADETGGWTMTIETETRTETLRIGSGAWAENPESALAGSLTQGGAPTPAAASAAWIGDSWLLRIHLTATPQTLTARLAVADDGTVRIGAWMHGWFGAHELATLVGRPA